MAVNHQPELRLWAAIAVKLGATPRLTDTRTRILQRINALDLTVNRAVGFHRLLYLLAHTKGKPVNPVDTDRRLLTRLAPAPTAAQLQQTRRQILLRYLASL